MNGKLDKKQRSSPQTRDALVQAGLQLFGEKGFDATTTREIAKLADTNIASIAYHFGGKQGLRMACAEEIVSTLSGLAGAQAIAFEAGDNPSRALEFLETVIERMIRFLTINPQSRHFVAFILREIAHPGPAMDLVYRQLFEPVHAAVCRIWAVAAETNAESDETRLAVFAIIGQALYFRIGQPIVLRRMGWDEITPERAEDISRTVIGNLRLAIQSRRERSS